MASGTMYKIDERLATGPSSQHQIGPFCQLVVNPQLFFGMLIASLNPVLGVRLGECEKFFAPPDLEALEFMLDTCESNKWPGVVCVVKINVPSSESSSSHLFVVQTSHLDVLSTWSDEGQVFGRASDGTCPPAPASSRPLQ